MGMPVKSVVDSETTIRQGKATSGTVLAAWILIALLTRAGIEIDPEVAVIVAGILTSLVSPLISRLLAQKGW